MVERRRDPGRRGRGPGSGAHTDGGAGAPFLHLGMRLRAIAEAEPPAPARAEVGRPPLAGGNLEILFRIIEDEIVPRVVRADASGARPRRGRSRRAPRPSSVVPLAAGDHERFLGLVMNGSAASTRRFVARLLEGGVSDEQVLVDLLPRAARRLGELWEDDRVGFSEVTIGLCRLHEVLRDRRWVLDRAGEGPGADAPRILLATRGDDQHVLGLMLVAEFFRRGGWRVSSEPGASRLHLEAILGEEDFDLLGLSAARDASVERLASEIASMRRAARNPRLKILVGGRLFAADRRLAAKVGADAVAWDARSAPIVAWDLIGRRER